MAEVAPIKGASPQGEADEATAGAPQASLLRSPTKTLDLGSGTVGGDAEGFMSPPLQAPVRTLVLGKFLTFLYLVAIVLVHL